MNELITAPRQGHQIDIGNAYELYEWSDVFGVTPDQLLWVVELVGKDLQAVHARMKAGPKAFVVRSTA